MSAEVRATDNSSYQYQARSQPYQQDRTEGRFGAKTGPKSDTVASPTDASAAALAKVAAMRSLFTAHYSECGRIFAALEAALSRSSLAGPSSPGASGVSPLASAAPFPHPQHGGLTDGI
ncbi:MAG: hypothetical protein ACYDC5_10635 [Candidatus Dormibacteria bacterium]